MLAIFNAYLMHFCQAISSLEFKEEISSQWMNTNLTFYNNSSPPVIHLIDACVSHFTFNLASIIKH